MNNLKFNDLILETILETQFHVETLENSVSYIEDAIQSGKTGLISPQLVTHFINALLEIKNNLNKELPFSLKLENYHSYIKTSTTDLAIIKNPVNYIIYKVTPIPISTWTQFFIFDNIHDGPIAISQDNVDCTFIDTQECIHLSSLKYCKIQYPILYRLVGNLRLI